jgi:hypothetical protein
MPSRTDYLKLPLAGRLARLAQTTGEIESALARLGDDALARRPVKNSWAPVEIVCHLRDIEELCIIRFHLMLVMDDPHVFVAGAPPADAKAWGIGGKVPFPLDPERWAVDRQYLHDSAAEAARAFRRRRQEVLAFLGRLTPQQWQRGSIHPEHGRVTFEDWTAGMAGHDDNHLSQLVASL